MSFRQGKWRCIGFAVLSCLLATLAQAKAPKGRFAVKVGAGGSVVQDTTFKLEWQQMTAVGDYTASDAVSYCQALALQGSGWRVPDIRELFSLVDVHESSPSIDKSFFPDTTPDTYLSATAGFFVYFKTGQAYKATAGGGSKLRCVR